ncbi:hypothetical protein Brms1b_009649 [Colletotrichum noveboracense]|nr:hypothetical protein Brms1b_009649 [Colletotrichum noveboracense]
MIDGNVVAYNAAVFVGTLFLLESGADKFVDHTAIVARRTGIPDTLIALLTAGAEWEELAVVVSALAQGRAPLALGNIVGSAISNILGAFSLGLLFRKNGEHMQFDRSARIYSLLLLGVTTVIAPITFFPREELWKVTGIILIVAFAIYIISVGWAISRGSLTAPEGSDSDSESSSDDERDAEAPPTSSRRRSNDALGASEVLFGIVVLAIGTTLPEKFVAVISGNRGHGGILVANTVGSNIFLLTLCLGIVMVGSRGELGAAGGVDIVELVVLWVTTAVFTITVWMGGRFDRLIGGLMLLGYVAFIVVEFLVLRRNFDL